MVGVQLETPVNICCPFSREFNTIGQVFTVLWLKYLPWLLGQGIFYSSMTTTEEKPTQCKPFLILQVRVQAPKS